MGRSDWMLSRILEHSRPNSLRYSGLHLRKGEQLSLARFVLPQGFRK